MKIFKNIFAAIWAVWAVILFSVTLLLFIVPFMIIKWMYPEPKRTHVFIRSTKLWIQIFLNGIACPLTVKGKENFAPGKNYIIVCNHNSMMDVPVSSCFIPGGNKTIAKKEMEKIPVFGIMYRMGSVLVDRKSDRSRRESYIKMKWVLESGLHMCIYPEGTRNTTADPLKSFHDGAFKLAKDTGKSVIPTLIFNTKKVLPIGKSFYVMPHRLEMHFLKPVEVNEGITVTELKDKVHEVMRAYYVANRN
jgi:1-acyl-sn-glycerol-3-phosphate acyltransferase